MVVLSEAAVEDLVVSYWPTRWQKTASAPDTVVQSGFTHNSKEPVSSCTNTGCGGVPMLTASMSETDTDGRGREEGASTLGIVGNIRPVC